MEKNQLDQFDMLQNVENLFTDNPTLWAGNAPVTTAKTGLSTRVSAIAAQYAIQLINITGIAEDKQTVRNNLERQMYVVGSAICNYADSINNKELFNKGYMTKTMLSDMEQDGLTGKCTDLIFDANSVIANLAPNGVLPATITTLSATLTAFSAIKKNPQNAIDRRKEATEKIAELLPEALEFVERRLDTAMVSLEATQEAFCGTYQNARAINSSPTTTISLITNCVDSATELPIEGAQIIVLSSNDQRVSPESGVNIFKNLPEGPDKLEVTHPLYIQQLVDFTLVNNQTTELIIKLELL